MEPDPDNSVNPALEVPRQSPKANEHVQQRHHYKRQQSETRGQRERGAWWQNYVALGGLLAVALFFVALLFSPFSRKYFDLPTQTQLPTAATSIACPEQNIPTSSPFLRHSVEEPVKKQPNKMATEQT